jgi:hypothetical protein
MNKREKIKKFIADNEGEIIRAVYYTGGIITGVGMGYMIATHSWNKNANVIVTTALDTVINNEVLAESAKTVADANQIVDGLVSAVKTGNKDVLAAVKSIPDGALTMELAAEAITGVGV